MHSRRTHQFVSLATFSLGLLVVGCAVPVESVSETGEAADQPEGTAESSLSGAARITSATTANLFTALNSKTASQIQQKIASEWATYKAQRIGTYGSFKFAGPGPSGGEVLSEGQSYGMMLAVQMGEQPLFDQLYGFVKNCMYINDSSSGVYGYHKWKVNSNCTTVSSNVAPDGEIWFAAALSLAARRWGSGAYNYATEAAGMWTRLLYPLNNWGGDCIVPNSSHAGYHMVRFGPYNDFTDPSYITPGFFALAQDTLSGSIAAEYSDIYVKGHNFLQNTPANPNNSSQNWGLHPDYATWSGAPYYPGYNDEYGPIFSYDAFRTVMNMAIDVGWTGNSSGNYWQVASRRQDQFYYYSSTVGAAVGLGVAGQQSHPYGQLITSGIPVSLIAMNATASALYSWADTERAYFTNQLWTTYHPSDYYGDNLYMLGLLVAGGQFRNSF